MKWWIQEIRGFLKRISKARVDAYAAQSAFYIIMGLIPFIMLLLTLIQYTTLTRDQVMGILMQVFPVSFQDFLMGIVNEIYGKSTTVISVTAVLAIWACSRGMLSVTNGLNSVNNIEETRNYLFRRIRSGFYVIFLLLALILAMVLFVFGNALHDMLIAHVHFLGKFSRFIIGLRTGLTLVILTLLIAAMYTFLPNRKQKFKTQLPGAAVTAISWSLYSFGFSIYLEMRGDTISIYGSLTMLVMLMLWLYFCMWLIFFGAMLNVYFKEGDNKENIKQHLTKGPTMS